jgi:hypothetical protein
MKSGNGKIANLPSEIREELNYRLSEGEPGTELVAWLNAKPEVNKVIAERFDGRPISEQNLSQWRTHGYRQRHAYHVILDELDTTSEHSEEIAGTGINCEKLLLSLTASYAEMLQRWIITPADEMTYKLAVFKNITNATLALRRAEIQKARLELDTRRLELLGERRRAKSASASSEAVGVGAEPPGVGAGEGAGGGPSKGGVSWEEASRHSGRPGKSRATGPSASSPGSTPASPHSGPESHSRPATEQAAPPAASLSPSSHPCVPPAEHPLLDSSSVGSAALDEPSFRSSDADLRTPSEPYGMGAVSTGSRPRACRGAGGGPGQGEPSAAATAGENTPAISERDETPGLDPAIPAPPPAIDYELWRGIRSPSFVGVPRGGPSRWRPGAVDAASPSAESPRTPPPPAPQPKPGAPPAVHPGATRPAPTLTRPFVPNQVRPRNPNKSVIATRPVPPLVEHNATVSAPR